jgi:rRNA maturation protein Nop10
LSESCPQIGDVPKSPVPPFGSAVPSAGKNLN